MVGILDVKYLNETGDVVEATNYTDLQTLGYTGGIWLESDIDWPCGFFFSLLLFMPHLPNSAVKQQRYTSTPYLLNSSNGFKETQVSPLHSHG